jgi:protease-4
MTRSFLAGIGSVLSGLWWLLDQTRRALLNLLLLLLVLGALWWLWNRTPPTLEPKTALVVAPTGRLVDQSASSGLRQTLLRQAQDGDGGQVRVRDLVAVLDAAAKDPQVPHALLLLDDLEGGGLPNLREVAAAVQRLRAAGKKVYAWSSGYSQAQYFVAAHADEVWMHPMGGVMIQGYGRHRNYYKEALDKLGVQANVQRVGKYKNAAEVYAATGPSPETLEAEGALYGTLWQSYTAGVEKARKLPTGAVMGYIDGLPGNLDAVGGHAGELAVKLKLVDALKTRDELRTLLTERGAADDKAKTFRQVSAGAYLARVQPKRDGPAVAVVVAQGEISDGQAPPGRVGGLSTAALVKKAREDEQVKAVVLRVNSPGGSPYGSELVRRELELTRAAGKPVVVSMGDVAASGGYWISLAADEILADEATITGSIGVVAMLPSAGEALGKLGVNAAGKGTTWLGTAYDPRRGLDRRYEQLLQARVDHVYRDFTTRTATARKTTPEKIDAVAQGRVWAGKDALAHGLVDRLGGLGDALKSAAARGKLGADYRTVYVEASPGRLDRWLQRFGLAELGDALAAWTERADGAASAAPLAAAAAALGLLPGAALPLLDDLAWLVSASSQDPPDIAAAHCLCVAP